METVTRISSILPNELMYKILENMIDGAYEQKKGGGRQNDYIVEGIDQVSQSIAIYQSSKLMHNFECIDDNRDQRCIKCDNKCISHAWTNMISDIESYKMKRLIFTDNGCMIPKIYDTSKIKLTTCAYLIINPCKNIFRPISINYKITLNNKVITVHYFDNAYYDDYHIYMSIKIVDNNHPEIKHERLTTILTNGALEVSHEVYTREMVSTEIVDNTLSFNQSYECIISIIKKYILGVPIFPNRMHVLSISGSTYIHDTSSIDPNVTIADMFTEYNSSAHKIANDDIS